MTNIRFVALALAPGIGGATLRALIDRFGDIDSVWEASPEALRAASHRVSPQVIAYMRNISLDQVEDGLNSWSDEGISVLTWSDDDYPQHLRDISSAPPILFARGDLLDTDQEAVAIIGTRQASDDRLAEARRIAAELAARGLTVVSGLAMGIDTAAHQGALDAAAGRTLAVLGSGLNRIHPRGNADLADRIAQRGAVLSELQPTMPVQGRHLMARNRIISGLSRAVIVVEAGQDSGTLNTARAAQKQRRLVLALPDSPGTRILVDEGTEPLHPTDTDWDRLAERISAYRAPKPEPSAPSQPSLL